jgi:glycosyltransferase involved in cell wall biosynthesis
MRILQVSNRVPWPLNEGGNIGIYNFTRAFCSLGHDVTIYCLDGLKHNTPVKEAQNELNKYAKTLIHPIDTDVKLGEALTHLITNKSYNVSRFYNTVFEQELVDLLKKESFDIIQLEGTFVGPYIDSIKTHHKGLLALRMHNVEFEIWQRLAQNESNPLKKVYLNLLSKQLKTYETDIIKKVDVIVPVTDDDGIKFKKLLPSAEVFTIPAGIDLNEWQYSPSNSYTNWYHIGSMEWHANAEAVNWYVSEINNGLLSLDSNYKLHLAGKGIDSDQFSKVNNVLVNDNVPRAYDFVKQQDVCVVPLKSGSGIRLKILEAMAAGKLVVSTTVGAQGIDYIDREHLLIADTPSEFAEIYSELKSGSIDFKTIVKNARMLIEENYSTEALAQKQMDKYQTLMPNKA